MQSLFEKLQLKDEKNLLIQGLPSSIEKQFVKLSYSKNVTPLLRSRKIDFALIFAVNQNQLCGILKEVLPALHSDSKLWIAYPKSTSKIVSDLNRDCSWQFLSSNHYEGVYQVALDHVWMAMQFKKLEEVCETVETLDDEVYASVRCDNTNLNRIDFDKRLVAAPAELESFFVKHKNAKDFFTSLSFTNQKEYVSFIEDAKRSDTKRRRLEAACEKLLAGKKTPTEK